ncbi:MAG: hypothetical protein ACI9MR_000483 [Myxococcota bacterium]|jgi:hypothetical protein
MTVIYGLASLILATLPLPDTPAEGRAAPPNPNSEWLDLSVRDRIPVEGLVYFRGHYSPTFESQLEPPAELDALISVAVRHAATNVLVAGTTTYDEDSQTVLWAAAAPLELETPYRFEVSLRYHENPERLEVSTFEVTSADGPWPKPAPPLPPRSFDLSPVCGASGCCPAQLSIQGALQAPDAGIRAEFRAEGSDTWLEEEVSSSRLAFFVAHTYPSFGPQACYRLTSVSLVNGLESAVVHCFPNPTPDPEEAALASGDKLEGRLPCVSVPEGLPPAETGCGVGPGSSPNWPWIALFCAGLWMCWRSARAAGCSL